ncbi:COQ6-like protein [Mya arenaria]|uniref:COQ6-like protein n=1 Tax=Mya arenaria TaxID=6604 RepID=A0ABY7FDZ3_MYAAR|nr:COQ6-like protein [Mya arenaria]
MKIMQNCHLCLATVRQISRLQPTIFTRYLSTANPDIQHADVVISGGGMVGAAMACALGHESLLQNKKIVLLEAAPKKKFTLTENYGNRTCTLSPGSIALFEKCGVWSEIENMRCQRVLRMQAITRRLDTVQDHIDVMYGTRAEEISIPGVDTELESNAWVEIGSDGMNSAVRKAANVHTVSFNYDQKAVTDNNVAWQRFLPTGPIAMLPMSDTAISLIWTTSPEHAKELLALSDESFVDAVNDAFFHDRDQNDTAGRVSDVFQNILRNVVPGGTSVRQLPPVITGVQPGSRQGVNLGFGDVTKLSEVITRAASEGSDLGSLTYLKEYETSRQRKVIPVMATVDGLQRLYSTDMTPVDLIMKRAST